MCDFPEKVRITSNITKHSASFDVRATESDVGKLLGTGGSYAFALRTIFTAVYGKLGKRFTLLIVDPRRRR